MTEENPNQQLVEYFSELTKAELVKRFGDTKGAGLHQLYDRQFKIHWNNYIHMLPDDVSKRHGINSLFVMALTTNNHSSAHKNKKSRGAQCTEAITYAYMTVQR